MSTLQDEQQWEKIQAKTFTNWVNEKLSKAGYKEIVDIYNDFSNGINLAKLLMSLQSDIVEYNPNPVTRIQKMENMERVLNFIISKNVRLINIGPTDIVDGNRKLILGLTWSLISKLAIGDVAKQGKSSGSNMREELLGWCKEITKDYKNIRLTDFSRSWKDGLAFNAIIHKFRPDLVPNFRSLNEEDAAANIEQAFKIAEDNLDIRRLLDVEDITGVPVPDEKSIMTYVSGFYQKFKQYEKEMSAVNRVKSLLEAVDWSIQSRNYYEIKAKAFLSKNKELEAQRKVVKNLMANLSTAVSSMQAMSAELDVDLSELHSLLGGIDAVHEFYSLVKYTPPEDVALENLKLNTFNSQEITSNENLRLLFSSGYKAEESSIIKFSETTKAILSNPDRYAGSISNVNELGKKMMEVQYSNSGFSKHQEELKRTLDKKVELLSRLQDKALEKDRAVEQATLLFNKVYKKGSIGIDVPDMINCINILGLSYNGEVPEESKKTGLVTYEDYIQIVKAAFQDSLGVIEMKKAFKFISNQDEILNLERVDMNEDEYKDLYYINKNSNQLDIEKFFLDFIKH